MKKLIISLVFGLLILQFSIMDVFAQSLLFGTTTSGQNNPSNFYQIDPATGNAVLIGPTGFNRCSAIDFHPITNVLYGTCTDNLDQREALVTINVNTGIGTRVGNTGITDITDMSFSNDGTTLFAHSFELLKIDIMTGIATIVGGSGGIGSAGNGLAMSQSNQLFHSDEKELSILDQDTGLQITSVLHGYPLVPDDLPRNNGMDFEPNSELLFASLKIGGEVSSSGISPQSFLVTVDTTTGTVTIVGQTVNGLDAIAFFDDQKVGGKLLPIETTSLLVSSAQSFSWMIPVALSAIGIGLFVVSRKFENS
ncbi:MAG: hypothetical protein ACE5RN_07230 [Nitrosopumilaceae archaeon]